MADLYEKSDRTITHEDVKRFEEIAASEGLTIDTTTIETIVVDGEVGEHSGFEQMLKTFSQTEVVSDKYVGDEFHFRLRMLAMEMPEIPSHVEIETETPISVPDFLVKMKREAGMWRIYRYGWNR